MQDQQAKQLQQQREQSLQTQYGLLDHAVNADDWRNQVSAVYRDAVKSLGDDPRLAAQATRLKQQLAAQAAEKQTAGDLASAISIAGFGIDLFPGDAAHCPPTRQTSAGPAEPVGNRKRLPEAQRNTLARRVG